jgi:two-component system sensor histidine kinase ChvG
MAGGVARFIPRRDRWVSPLTLRIFLVNLFALVTLAGGVLYLDQLRVRLLEQRQAELVDQAQLMATSLSVLAERTGNGGSLDAQTAATLVARMAADADVRVRLFDARGRQIADNRWVDPDDVQARTLAPPGEWDWSQFRRGSALALDRIIEFLGSAPKLEPFVEPGAIDQTSFPELTRALEGAPQAQMRRRDDGIVIINVAVPVQAIRKVNGAVMLTADTRAITRAVRRERLLSFYVFCGALTLTLLLSVFLSRTIARPLKRLAVAAERVRLGRGREVAVPRFQNRSDEIGDLARALNDMTQTLHVRMDATEAFAADVSHELKNPLSSIRSAAEVLGRTSDPGLQRQLIDILQFDADRMGRLITDISDASRLDAELSRAQMAPLDLRLMLDTLLATERTTAAGQHVRIVYAPPSEPMLVSGLQLRLGQVVRNLLDNAESFSPPGGTVTLSLAAEDGVVRLAVEDEGPGIPEANLADIFKRFYSERPDGEAFGKHSGLGLAIAKQIIEAHGGTLTAANRADGRGARFEIALPRAEQEL